MLFQRQSLLILLAGVNVGAFTTTPTTFVSPSIARSPISDSRLGMSDFLTNLSVESSPDDDAVGSVVDAAVAAASAPAAEGEEAESAVSEEAEIPAVVEASSEEGAAEADAPAAEDGEKKPKSTRREQRPHTAYVVNLSYETTNADLREAFGEYGNVVSVYAPLDRKNNRPKGIAFVSMSTEEELEAVLAGMVDAELGGRKIFVNKAKKKGEKSDKDPNSDPMSKLYIGNISFETSSKELLDHFSQYGSVKDCYVPTARETGLPRGFAFITMSKDGCEAAISGSDGMEFGGRSIEVKHSLPRGTKAPKREKSPQTKLYIGNLSFETEEDVLREVFEQYGTLIDVYMPIDRYSGEPRGFAFITVHPDVAAQIVEELDGFELDGRCLRVNEARPKGESPPSYDENNDEYAADSQSGDDASYNESY